MDVLDASPQSTGIGVRAEGREFIVYVRDELPDDAAEQIRNFNAASTDIERRRAQRD